MSQTPLTSVTWVAVAVSDIAAARPGALVTAFQSTALYPGQADPSLYIIQKCTNELLGAIGYSGRYIMDASQGQNGAVDVVPPNLFNDLVEEICRTMEKRLGMPWTPDETNAARDYRKIMLDLMKGSHPVMASNNPGNLSSISAPSGAVATIAAPPRQFGGGCGWGGGNPL